MQQVPELSPFIFAYESRAHEQRAEQNEDTVVLDQRQGLAAIFDGMGSRRGADALGQVASQQAAQVVHRGWERLLQQARVRYPETTVALVAFCSHRDEGSYTMVSAHVGDSRIYLLRASHTR